MIVPAQVTHVIKVCGITSVEDGLAVAEAGVTAIGLNFYARSRRYISYRMAAGISEAIPSQVWRVGIFVNPEADELARAANEVRLDVLQIHGRAPQTTGNSLRIWKAATVDSSFSGRQLDLTAEAYLLDAPAQDFGGSGQTFDWTRTAGIDVPFLLAGGLDEQNVADAIATARPWGVDASSRLESAPGKKDARKVREFVRAAEAAFAAIGPSLGSAVR